MFPSRDLPAIVNENNTAPNEPNTVKQSEKKRVFPITIPRELCGTILCLIIILLIIAIAILIGLLSVFLPKSIDGIPITPSAETVTLTLVLPITQNSSNVLSLNNNSLMIDNYLNNAQRNILKNCLQTRLNMANVTKLMTVLSIDSAHVDYSTNTNTQSVRTRRRRSRIRRQILPSTIQIEMTISIRCNPLISKTDCQQFVTSVLDNGEFVSCTATDTMITTLRSSSLGPTTIKTVAVAKTDHWRQVGELFLAFGLTSLVGLERQLRGKSAGLRTHSIVGTTSALILQVSKYGFSDVIHEGMVVLDPSRIAAQIISGISFLGAGLIITRQTAIRGLTTAASVWSAAAIGMAAGAGLWVLSLAVTGLHFVILLGFLPLEKRLPVFDKNSPLHVKGENDDDDDGNDDDESV